MPATVFPSVSNCLSSPPSLSPPVPFRRCARVWCATCERARLRMVRAGPGEPDCQFFVKTGNCGFGESCKFNHPPEKVPHLLHTCCILVVRAVRRSASTPPVLVSCTTSLSPRGTLFPAACAESITGLLSANTHALASALYYPHTSQLRSTRYVLPHAVRHLPCPNSPRARALLKYRPCNFLLEDPAKPNLFSS